MCHGLDHLSSGISRQLSVCIQSNHETHFKKCCNISDHRRKTTLRAAERGVEIGQLSALALVSHPRVFLQIPATISMQEKKPVAVVCGILLIETINSFASQLNKFSIVFQSLLRSIFEIREQGKVQMRITIGEITDLQTLQQSIDSGAVRQHRGHGNQCRMLRRYPFAKIHTWQRLRTHKH